MTAGGGEERGRESLFGEAWLCRCSGHAPMPLLDSRGQVRLLFDLVGRYNLQREDEQES